MIYSIAKTDTSDSLAETHANRIADADAVLQAAKDGYIATVERRALTPLAMGNHIPVVTLYRSPY